MPVDMSLGRLQELVLDREAWRAAVHGVTKSRTRLSDWTELNWVFLPSHLLLSKGLLVPFETWTWYQLLLFLRHPFLWVKVKPCLLELCNAGGQILKTPTRDHILPTQPLQFIGAPKIEKLCLINRSLQGLGIRRLERKRTQVSLKLGEAILETPALMGPVTPGHPSLDPGELFCVPSIALFIC